MSENDDLTAPPVEAEKRGESQPRTPPAILATTPPPDTPFINNKQLLAKLPMSRRALFNWRTGKIPSVNILTVLILDGFEQRLKNEQFMKKDNLMLTEWAGAPLAIWILFVLAVLVMFIVRNSTRIRGKLLGCAIEIENVTPIKPMPKKREPGSSLRRKGRLHKEPK